MAPKRARGTGREPGVLQLVVLWLSAFWQTNLGEAVWFFGDPGNRQHFNPSVGNNRVV